MDDSGAASTAPGRVSCEVREQIAVVRIDHPPLNTLDVATKEALRDTFRELDRRREEIRAVVLAGAGEEAFAAGADVNAFPELTPESAKRRLMRSHRIFAAVEGFARPVIAAIRGYCLGAGLELALCCDVRYASDDAQFGFPEVKLSIFPGNGGTRRALYHVSLGKLKELIFGGEMIGAQEALRYGLVEKVVPAGQVLDAALELAARIARRGPLGVAAAKRVLNRSRDLPLPESLELESDLWSALAGTQDMKEGAQAFLEKRKPRYRCR